MRESKCQTAASLDLSKELSLTTTSLFLHELERARRNIFKFILTIKNMMDICSPLNGLGDFINISFGSIPLTFSLSFSFPTLLWRY